MLSPSLFATGFVSAASVGFVSAASVGFVSAASVGSTSASIGFTATAAGLVSVAALFVFLFNRAVTQAITRAAANSRFFFSSKWTAGRGMFPSRVPTKTLLLFGSTMIGSHRMKLE